MKYLPTIMTNFAFGISNTAKYQCFAFIEF